jgi:hypothetical protein
MTDARAIECTGKHGFPTMQAANTAARHAHGRVQVYRCDHCRLYHLGGARPKVNSSKRARERFGRRFR